MENSLNPHFEEYFDNINQTDTSKIAKELFKVDKNNTDIKTDLNSKEIYNINAMKMIDSILIDFGVGSVFNIFYDDYMRLKISKDRQSRSEFVKATSSDKSENLLEGAKSFGTLFSGGVKK